MENPGNISEPTVTEYMDNVTVHIPGVRATAELSKLGRSGAETFGLEPNEWLWFNRLINQSGIPRVGTLLLDKVLEYCEEKNYPIANQVSAYGDINQQELENWYIRKGFVPVDYKKYGNSFLKWVPRTHGKSSNPYVPPEEKYRLVRRTKRGSLVTIERVGQKARLEVTNPEDMRDISNLLNASGIQWIMFQEPTQQFIGWIIEFDFSELERVTKGLPLMLEEPVQEIGEGSKPAKGTCYEDAWRFMGKHEDGFLVHGSVQLSAEGPRINHAWVELSTGWVWEPQTKGYITTEDFRVFSPVEHHRYTFEQAFIITARTGNMGPWSEEERAEWLQANQ